MRTHSLIVGIVLVTVSLSAANSASAQLQTRPILTASAAMKMVHGCLTKAGAEGWRMHIAILDNHGNLKAYHRMDDAQLLSHDVAMAKARSSALPRLPIRCGHPAVANGKLIF